MKLKASTKALMIALTGSMAMATMHVEAEAKPKPKTTAASASKSKPKATKPGGAGTTQGSATANQGRPNTNRNRVGYKPRTVTFRQPSRADRTAASTLRRTQRGNAVALGTAVRDRRAPGTRSALATKQATRGKPEISKTSTTALQAAIATGRRPTEASRGAVRIGAAPIGSGRRDINTTQLARETAQRRGLPMPQTGQRPSLGTRIANGFKSLFSRRQ